MHNDVVRVIIRAANTNGLPAEYSPSTAGLLGGELTPEQCRHLFPQRVTVESKKNAETVGALLQAADALRDRGRRAEILRQVDEVLAQQPGNTKGRRFDGTIHPPEAPDLHLDASLTHTCSSDKNRNQATLDMLVKECNLDFGHNAAHPTPTPAVSQRTQHKRDAYAPIMQRLRARTLQRRRAHCPEMVPVVISHLGEFSAGVFKVTETIAMAAYVRARDGPRHDGIHPKMHSADVRNMIKDRLICTVARGFGTMLGRPGMRPPPQQARC